MNVSELAATQSHPQQTETPSFNPDGAYNVLPHFDPDQPHDMLPDEGWEHVGILPLAHRTTPAVSVMGTDESGRLQEFTQPSTRLAIPAPIEEYIPDLFHLGKGIFNILEGVRSGRISSDQLSEAAPYLSRDFAELALMLSGPEGSMAAGAAKPTLKSVIAASKVAEQNYQKNKASKIIQEAMDKPPPAFKALHESFDDVPKSLNEVADYALHYVDNVGDVHTPDMVAREMHNEFSKLVSAVPTAKEYGLTLPEAMSPYYYSRHGNELINGMLRGDTFVPEQAAKLERFKTTLNSALDKLAPVPAHRTLWRGAPLDLDQLSHYVEGEAFTESAYTSTSTSKEQIYQFLHAAGEDWDSYLGDIYDKTPTIFEVIHSGKNGKYIAGLSHFPGEREALFKPGTRWMTEKITTPQNTNEVHIRIREIPTLEDFGQLRLPFPELEGSGQYGWPFPKDVKK